MICFLTDIEGSALSAQTVIYVIVDIESFVM
jgi:hypothetical protein